MVVVATMGLGWLTELGLRMGIHPDNNNNKHSVPVQPQNTTRLGILAFETAKIMSRLISLYKSVSDHEFAKLRNELMKSRAVTYLNSNDESFLLSLACAEKLEELDKAATAVARFGHKCSDFGLYRFDLVYADLKSGVNDFSKLEYGSKEIEKRVEKMSKLLSATSCLYESLEILTEMETSERKLNQWKQNAAVMKSQKVNFDLFYYKIEHQRKKVRNFKETSLWSQTFDKSVGLMARTVCILYARICTLFGPYIPALKSISLRNFQQKQLIRFQPEYFPGEPIKEPKSGPLTVLSKPGLVRFYSRKSIFFLPKDSGHGAADGVAKNNGVFHAAGPSTVGGSGLALRYANVILLAEKYLKPEECIGDDAREDLYMMLPENLKAAVRSKLSKITRRMDDHDESLAEGWRDALKEIMGWLAPMAHDTVTWQLERNVDKSIFDARPSVLLLHTLHFADKEKTEAAIVEVLVGLSCIYRYEHRRQPLRRWGLATS